MEKEESATEDEKRKRVVPEYGWSLKHAAIIILALAAVGFSGSVVFHKVKDARGAGGRGADGGPSAAVRTVAAERRAMYEEISSIGAVTPRSQAEVAANIGGRISSMPLLLNKYVRAGDVVAELDAGELRARREEAAAALDEAKLELRNLSSFGATSANAENQKALAEAQANFNLAKSAYDRLKEQFDKGAAAKGDVDAAYTALTNAENDLQRVLNDASRQPGGADPKARALSEAHVAQARRKLDAIDAQLSYATVHAPISGVVIEQSRFEGDYAAAGAALLTIADTSVVTVNAPFDYVTASQIMIGDPVKVYPREHPGQLLTGTVTMVGGPSGAASRTVDVQVVLNNTGGLLRPNSTSKIVVSTNMVDDAVVLPLRAVKANPNGRSGTIMIVDDDNKARTREVTLGASSEGLVQVISGLRGGESVIVEGGATLSDGEKVDAKPAEMK